MLLGLPEVAGRLLLGDGPQRGGPMRERGREGGELRELGGVPESRDQLLVRPRRASTGQACFSASDASSWLVW